MRILLRHAVHGGLWAALLLLVPISLLILLSPLLLPVFIWRETRSFRPVSPLLEAAVRYGTLAGVLMGGIALPLGSAHRRLEPFPAARVTLGELAEARAIYFSASREFLHREILLPSRSPTRVEIATAIREQTELRARSYPCWFGANLLFGPSFGAVSVRDPERPGPSHPTTTNFQGLSK